MLTILGRGFAEGGSVDEVIIDRDGNEPFDYVLTAAAGQFRVESDRAITGVKLPDVAEGAYQVFVRHPTRGMVRTNRDVLTVDAQGLIKYGPFGDIFQQPLDSITRLLLSLSATDVMVVLIVLFLSAIFFSPHAGFSRLPVTPLHCATK